MKVRHNKFRNLVSKSDDIDVFDFPNILRKIRQERQMSRRQLAEAIGKTIQQVQRYETNFEDDHQNPPLHIFKKICLILQVDANELLGLKWVIGKAPAQVGIIYDWELKNDVSLHWMCPQCQRENITYNNDYKKSKDLIFKHNFQCEYADCGAYFERLKKK